MEHNAWKEFAGDATIIVFVSHMVSTIPVTANKWVNWLVGGIQVAVGQRLRGINTIQGEMTLSKPAGPPPAPSATKVDIH